VLWPVPTELFVTTRTAQECLELTAFKLLLGREDSRSMAEVNSSINSEIRFSVSVSVSVWSITSFRVMSSMAQPSWSVMLKINLSTIPYIAHIMIHR
jgi:hypothetical protein